MTVTRTIDVTAKVIGFSATGQVNLSFDQDLRKGEVLQLSSEDAGKLASMLTAAAQRAGNPQE
jgi:hypothetical protein